MSKGTVLVVGSNAKRIEIQGGGTGPTGQYLNELVVPVMALLDAGYGIAFATPTGSKPFIDPVSDHAVHFDDDESAHRKAQQFFATHPSMNNVATLRSILDGGLDEYLGFFTPGGQAPVVDLMQDADLGKTLRHFHQSKKPTALLCHGPIATASAMSKAKEFRAALIAGDEPRAADAAKGWQYAGYRMTVYSASEEKPIEDNVLHGKMYFHMPEALTIAGATVETGPDFAPHVVEDRELITGQNPKSDHPIAAKLISAIERVAADNAKQELASATK
ncbi:type 1 glutamine amidotransferase domain-containing protein [Mesorhizobium sangaii]|uniref:Putative intracellular protease/amidase n=1 Tax=Mesorhizobium sangaii TaxID=505389 RepID=A0A841PGQ5_9HYPH|nr:type 1 glutamine amidotransferase domain-containing protein [Mesorhizobium sangaii]MBB6409970.1 putative intracellular protease/amidase [Mesorhizobium sangaii]